MTLADVAAATGGELCGPPAVRVTGVGQDSRTLEPGALFVAVRGERDGHAFVADARDRGAAAALVERTPPDAGIPVVVVRDTTAALAALAAAARVRLEGAAVVAITGSTGKTSTKDLCRAALARTRRTHASPDSYNNELGVPLTVLNAPPGTEALVVELGARGRGQIAELARVVRPRVGVVTTVGPAHTELFGSLEEVARTKAELLEALPGGGTAVVGTGHEWVELLVRAARAPVLRVGREASDDVRVSGVEIDGELRPRFVLETPWGRAHVGLELRGTHQAMNAALAAAAAVSAGAPFTEVVAGLSDARGARWRMEVCRVPGGAVVLNDAYNANPLSTLVALEALVTLEVSGRRFAVLGEMAELGPLSAEEHRRVGRRAAECGVDRLLVVGESDSARLLADEAEGGGCAVERVATPEDAARWLAAQLQPGDAVLLKASRVVGLERVVEFLGVDAGGGPGRGRPVGERP